MGMALTVDSAIVDSDPIAFDLIGGLFGASSAPPTATRLGRRMAALYATWQGGGLPDLAALATGMLRRNGIVADTPVARTCVAAASAVAAWGGLPYHSATHHAEVTTNAMVLVELARRRGQIIDRHATALLLAACLSHDIYYSPRVARVRFAAENASAEALDAIAAACGCDAADRQAMRALVIATEPMLRLRPGGPLGAPLEPRAARLLGCTSVDPNLAMLATLLSDADMLSSVGLTVGWYRVQEMRLEQEADRPAELGDSERFFSDIVGPDFLSDAGRVFSANLATIRRSVRRPD
jgi:hypothetical protein